MKRSITYTFLWLSVCLIACEGDSKPERHGVSRVAIKSNYRFTAPDPSAQYYLNDELEITIGTTAENIAAIDSARVYMDGNLIGKLIGSSGKVSWSSKGSRVGLHKLTAAVFSASNQEKLNQGVILFSDEKPKDYSFKIVKSYPHDEQAFTQGLIFSDGILYEGTGQKGSSELRKVELATGEILQRKKISNTLFGEGITLFDDHLYQLTWQAGLGLVYDKETFEEVSRFYYQDEGWGLTNNEEALIMSDGSNKLRFLDPGDFHVLREIWVYDHNGAIGYLNELEWIDGYIYANVWQRDIILIIDPENGKVKGKINLSGLLPASQQKRGVLNGIAWDAGGRRLFVTGKFWPGLYEIELIEKKTTSS